MFQSDLIAKKCRDQSERFARNNRRSLGFPARITRFNPRKLESGIKLGFFVEIND